MELTWGAVTDARRYVIVWDNGGPEGDFQNVISGIEDTSYAHTGLTNFQQYRYRIMAETSGGRGPESLIVSATPGPVPGNVEWAAVTSQDPGHTIHFATAEDATHYRIYFAASEAQLLGRRPNAPFEEAEASPHVREDIPLLTPVFYRVIAMNDSRIGTEGPIAISPTQAIAEHDFPDAGIAFGDPSGDGCLDLPTGRGTTEEEVCLGGLVELELDEAGLGDLLADGRVANSRFADFDGDGSDDLFSSTRNPADEADKFALLHLNDGTGDFETSGSMSALGIGGFSGTALVADFDNDGDVDLFVPHDHTTGDGARNWLLMNDGSGTFTDVAAGAGLDANPPGDAFAPRGGQAVDFDEDGFVDILFGSRLMLNGGDGTFSDGSAAANVPVRADDGLKLVDIDLDGDLDLLHHDGSVTRLHRNDGGVFDAGTIFNEDTTQATFGNGLNACDINVDGFEDVIVPYNVSGPDAGVPRLYVNVAGTLMPSAVQEGTTADADAFVGPNGVVACADLNGDGNLDPVIRWGGVFRRLSNVNSLSNRFRIRVVGPAGELNQQGRIVRAVPRSAPDRILTRVVESGSGLFTQNQYDLLFGAPWPGTYDVTVGFAGGEVTTTAVAGDLLTVFPDGTVENDRPEDEG